VLTIVDGVTDTTSVARVVSDVLRWGTILPESIEQHRSAMPSHRDWLATVDGVLEKAPSDGKTVAARARMKAAVDKLAAVRATYDKLLGAASSADAPVDQDALLDRFSKALVGP